MGNKTAFYLLELRFLNGFLDILEIKTVIAEKWIFFVI